MFFLEDPRCIAIELEHGGVELQHILRSYLRGARGLGADDRLEVGRHFGGARWRAIFDGCQSRDHQTDAADDYGTMLHEFSPMREKARGVARC
jgi:hypothetical protein